MEVVAVSWLMITAYIWRAEIQNWIADAIAEGIRRSAEPTPPTQEPNQ